MTRKFAIFLIFAIAITFVTSQELNLGYDLLNLITPEVPQTPKVPFKTVDYVNLTRFAGKWHTIARKYFFFERNCRCETAEYSLRKDGLVEVVNKCKWNGQRPIVVKGSARPIDDTNSKLIVEFYEGILKAPYWVVALDDDYQWAMIGNPEQLYLYILSREPTLDDSIVLKLILQAKDLGYKLENLIFDYDCDK
eukprot:TRINITY_DN3570_c0_g2_i1.p1 TRINITY_DN3570_c0_g2~~TRINITY_DN3570_c0_g2_i1.p1  ORF type:complete len:194 (-),score=45.73 TRINITY_DN3570_c0_g2_i1:145-726(-)